MNKKMDTVPDAQTSEELQQTNITTQLANALATALPAGQEKPKYFSGAANQAIHWVDHYENIAESNNWNVREKLINLRQYKEKMNKLKIE